MRAPPPFADENLVHLLARPDVSVLVGRLGPMLLRSDRGISTGVAFLEDMTALRGLAPSGRLRVRVTRAESESERFRRGRLGWNGVELIVGVHLLVAFDGSQSAGVGTRALRFVAQLDRPPRRPMARPLPLGPLLPGGPVGPVHAPPLTPAAARARALHDPLVLGVQKALAVEDAHARSANVSPELEEGVTSPNRLFAEYAFYAAGRLGRVPRDEAIRLSAVALAAPTAPPHSKKLACTTLQTDLWSKRAQDPGNARITATLLDALPEAEPRLARDITLGLHRTAGALGRREPRAMFLKGGEPHPVGLERPPEIRRRIEQMRGDPAFASSLAFLLRLVPRR